MAERFGVVRGLSSEDVSARYTLHCLYGGFPAGGNFSPDPLDPWACLLQAERDPDKDEWVLRFSWRPPWANSVSP